MTDLKTWLENHPEWILRTELEKFNFDKTEIQEIFMNKEFGFVTADGLYFENLNEVPTFVGLRQVIRYHEKGSLTYD